VFTIYLKMIGHFWRLCIARETHYRANFIALAWVAVVQTLMTILPMLLVYSYAGEVSGWSQAESLALVGLFQVAVAIHELVASGGAYRLSADIQHGDLDLILVRPVNAQFYVTFRYVSLPNLANVVIGALVFAIGISRANIAFSVAASAQSLVIFVCGLVLVSAVILGGNYIAFRATTVEGLSWMLQDVAAMGRYPITFYPLAVRAFLTGIMPVAFVTVLPIDALRGSLGWGTCALAVTFAALAVLLLRWWWGNSVRHYTSASS
jgi:ABC-2 type transport system permease protein